MAERDYAKEYEREKKYKKLVNVSLTPELFNKFASKTGAEGVTRNAFLKSCVISYINNEITIDECGRIHTVE